MKNSMSIWFNLPHDAGQIRFIADKLIADVKLTPNDETEEGLDLTEAQKKALDALGYENVSIKAADAKGIRRVVFTREA